MFLGRVSGRQGEAVMMWAKEAPEKIRRDRERARERERENVIRPWRKEKSKGGLLEGFHSPLFMYSQHVMFVVDIV